MKHFDTNKNAFKLPDNYFNQLEDSILIESKKLPEKNGFIVPENYFSELEDKIVSTAVEQNKQGKVRKLWIAISSVAACLIIASISLYPLINASKKVNTAKIEVDKQTEDDVYESLYDAYFDDENKKSSNEITLDDLDDFYSEKQLSSNN